MIKKIQTRLFWLWLIILILINVIPIGSDTSLNKNRFFEIRLDYFIHAVMILCFAWIWVHSRITGVTWFKRYEGLKYSVLVLCAGVCLELLQLLVPWRSFNPVDMIYNVMGAILVVILISVSSLLSSQR
jgi:VanZ family protein